MAGTDKNEIGVQVGLEKVETTLFAPPLLSLTIFSFPALLTSLLFEFESFTNALVATPTTSVVAIAAAELGLSPDVDDAGLGEILTIVASVAVASLTKSLRKQ